MSKGLFLLMLVAAPAAAQSDTSLTHRLDSIAGYWVERGSARRPAERRS
jgi:hypothetical protein